MPRRDRCLTIQTGGRKALLQTPIRPKSAPLAKLPVCRKPPPPRSSTAPCVVGRSGKPATGACTPDCGNCSASKPPHNPSVEPTCAKSGAVGSLFAISTVKSKTLEALLSTLARVGIEPRKQKLKGFRCYCLTGQRLTGASFKGCRYLDKP